MHSDFSLNTNSGDEKSNSRLPSALLILASVQVTYLLEDHSGNRCKIDSQSQE